MVAEGEVAEGEEARELVLELGPKAGYKTAEALVCLSVAMKEWSKPAKKM